MDRLPDLLSSGDIETVFAPLLARFPPAMRYLSTAQLDNTWPAITSSLKAAGDREIATMRREAAMATLMAREHVQLASEIDRDPFKTLIRTILSARSKDEQTIKVSDELFEHYDTAERLAAADPEHVKEIIKPIGFYNAKTRYVIGAAEAVLRDHGGKVPDTMEDLVALPGVGKKVAGCVLVYAFDKPAIPVDTHVHRIVNRWGLVETTDPGKTNALLEEILPVEWWKVINDLLVRHGKEICKPITPACDACPVEQWCPKIVVKKARKGKKRS